MINFTDMLVFAGMLFLRFGVPLLIVIGIGYLLKRLDRRWEAEAWPSRRRPRRPRSRLSSLLFHRSRGPPYPRGRPCRRRCSRSSAASARNTTTSAGDDDGTSRATMLRRERL